MIDEKQHSKFIERAIELAEANVDNNGGGPFGAVVVKNGEIIAEGSNQVTSSSDPTAHAEIEAIRAACEKLQSHQLDDCIIYSSCEPCPMCLGAIYWARPLALYYAASRHDAADAGFDDSLIYEEFNRTDAERKIKTRRIVSDRSAMPFKKWIHSTFKKTY